jgi:hypothetical protein
VIKTCANCQCPFETPFRDQNYCPICYEAKFIARRIARIWAWVRDALYPIAHPVEAWHDLHQVEA